MIPELIGNRKKLLFYYLPALGLLLLILARLVHSYLKNPQIDFLAYLDVSRAVIKNLNPYSFDDLIYFPWERLQVCYPGIAIFFIPFVFMGKTVAGIVYFILNSVCAGALFYMLFKVTGLWKRIDFRNPDRHFMWFWILAFAYFNSQPVLACLRHGQIALIVSLAIMLILVKIRLGWKVFFFIFAAVQKYSMITFLGPLMFIKGRYWFCIFSFIGFILVSLTPMVFGVDIVLLYSDYVNELSAQLKTGFNTYAGSGYNMLQVECFKMGLVNYVLKGFFVLLFLYVLLREWRKPKYSLNLLMFIFSCSMLVNYHRVYDLGLVNALIAVKFIYFLDRKQYLHSTIAGLLMLFFLIPQTIYFHICRILGKFPGAGDLFYLADYYQGISGMFPLLPFVVMFMTLWSWYLYQFTDVDFEFEGKDYVGETQTTTAG
jgi:Glycosyltransferase family 87